MGTAITSVSWISQGVKYKIIFVLIIMSKFRNQSLASKVGAMTPKENLVASNAIPKPNTKNISGKEAYVQDKWLKLLTMLNTLKLENQFYRSENQTAKDLRSLIIECAQADPYFTAQCIVYSRCVGEGMRSINHLAAVYLSAHVSGLDWSKRFYGLWNKKDQKGGTIFRPDDISEIVAAYTLLNPKVKKVKTKAGMVEKTGNVSITNAMKKGFKSALENMDTYSLLKYKSSLLDVINLVRPNPSNSKAVVQHDGKTVSVFEAIIKGYNVSADTWEMNQSDAGQIVAKAVKEGKLSKNEAEEVLKEAKSDNWESMLIDNKLGVLAALRNIRSILLAKPKTTTIELLCKLLSNKDAIRNGKIMPYQIDLANEVINAEFSDANSRRISKALLTGYELALPNLKELLAGDTLVMVDFSGSMTAGITDPKRTTKYRTSCQDKAALIAATIAKATNGDIIRFGSNAEYVNYNANLDVFTLAKSIQIGMGGTNLSQAWKVAQQSGRKYTRVFILSDNECNVGSTYKAYQGYVEKTGDPYVYSVDLGAYGTNSIAGPKVRYYYGYGYTMFDDIATCEFNANYHLEKVKKIII